MIHEYCRVSGITFRPTATDVLDHCLFWNPNQQLHFFLSFSEWIDTMNPEDPFVKQFERDGSAIFMGNWIDCINNEEITQSIIITFM